MMSEDKLYNIFDKQAGDYKSIEGRTKCFKGLDNNPELVTKGVKYTDNFGSTRVGNNPLGLCLDVDEDRPTPTL